MADSSTGCPAPLRGTFSPNDFIFSGDIADGISGVQMGMESGILLVTLHRALNNTDSTFYYQDIVAACEQKLLFFEQLLILLGNSVIYFCIN